MSRTAVQIPGDPTPNTDVSLPALNNADADPDRVAAEREALTQSRAASAAVERGDLAGAQKILADALALPEEERESLANALLTSLHRNPDEIDQAWANEAVRRLESEARGETTAISWDSAQRQVKAKFGFK